MSGPLANTKDAANDVARLEPHALAAGAQVHTYSSVEEIPKPLLDLFAEVGRQSFLLTLPWFQNFIKTTLGPEDQVRAYGIIGTGEDASTRALLLMRSSRNSGGLFSPRKLESLSNYYSCYFSPHLTASGDASRELLRKIAMAIAGDKPRWDIVEIKPLAADSNHFLELGETFKGAGFVVQTYFSSGNWYLPVNGRSFAQYMESLPSVLKNTLNRKRKKLEKTGRARIEIVTGGPGLDAAIAAYTRVYLSSWKKPEPHPQFMPGLISTCAAAGTLRLGIVYVDGQPAASQLWIVHNGHALIYKLAYDEQFGELSVGTILSATLFQYVLDVDKVSEVDYLSGDDSYKKDWMSHRRERWGILALNPRTPRGALAIARHVCGRAVKRAALSIAGFGSKERGILKNKLWTS